MPPQALLRATWILALAICTCDVIAQPSGPLEYQLPEAVQDSIQAHISTSQDSADRFIIWRGEIDDAYEIAIPAGGPTACEARLLERSNRVATIGGQQYGILLSDDTWFAVDRWVPHPYREDERMGTQCIVLHHYMYVVRFALPSGAVVSARVVF